jgi:PTH1 family peptidyl-tRNA hydrolase
MTDRWLVIGLGNPGDQYLATRHNIGQMVISHMANSNLATGVKFSRHKSGMVIADLYIGSESIVLAKSLSYMNESGVSARALIDFYKVPLDHIIAVHDELDIPFETMKIKMGGGDNGHNGLKSLTSHFGSSNYNRLRMGIGRPLGEQDPASFVLKPFSTEERKVLVNFIARGALAIESLILKGLETTQQEFNN